jgi:catechol 2,3-dioxygenase-like lactoylglutathione lyase family enzyme
MGSMSAHSHVAIVTNDIAAAGAFYVNVFGFTAASGTFRGAGPELERIMGVVNPRIEGLFLSLGGFVIELLHYRGEGVAREPARSRPDQPGYGHLSFVVDSVTERMDAAESWGGSADRGSRTEIALGGGTPVVMGFVADPDGNLIELIEHPDASAAGDHAGFLRAGSLGWPPRLTRGEGHG